MTINNEISNPATMHITNKAPHFNVERVARPNVLAMKPYRCARDDYDSGILLDANENTLGDSLPDPRISLPKHIQLPSPPSYMDEQLYRYPCPYQREIKRALGTFRGLSVIDNSSTHLEDYVFLGVGSDESLDMLMRIFCVPGKDAVLITPPTYGMYKVVANMNDVGIVEVPLITENGAFQLDVEKILETVKSQQNLKLLFLCSPGNPTGTLLRHEDIIRILECPDYTGLVVVDEAYVDFCSSAEELDNVRGTAKSVASWVMEYPNLVVTQTLSKSFGLAGIRLGAAIGQPNVISLLNKFKAPYNIATPTSLIARSALSPKGLSKMACQVKTILHNRAEFIKSIETLSRKESSGVVGILGANDANFVLVRFVDPFGKLDANDVAYRVYKELAEKEGIVVRYRGMELGCHGCLRMTIGTQEENELLLEKMQQVLKRVLNM